MGEITIRQPQAQARAWHELLDCSRYALCRRRPDSCLLLLGGCDLVLLTTLYAVRLDRVSDRTHSAGVQNCRDWSVVSSRSADSVFFFLMKRRPPRSTLFPYTTLVLLWIPLRA